ncbi:MAG: glucose-6-phosphate isomerase, partial [Cyanobacteria bacterium M5B4]
FFVTFFEVLNDRPPREIDKPQIEVEPGVYSGDYLSGALLGTRKALFENKRDSITITIADVTPGSVGALIALYERAVGFYASLVNINAYDQPGVEAGKKAANYVLQLQTRILDLLNQENRPMGLEELSQKTAGDIETIYQIVRHLDANFRINLEGNTGKPDTLLISPLQES